MSAEVRTALIPAGGAGGRMFPGGTIRPKVTESLSVGNRGYTVFDFMARECMGLLPDLERIILVTTPEGEHQIDGYLGDINPYLEAQLRTIGKTDVLEAEQARREAFRSKITLETVIQPPDVYYGTAYPPYLAKDRLAGEKRFAIFGGDDIVYHPTAPPETDKIKEILATPGVDHIIMGKRVKRSKGSNYGIFQRDDQGRLLNIDEKPPIERIPKKPMANVSRVIASEMLLEFIEADMAQNRGTDEHRITDAINEAAQAGQSFKVLKLSGVYLDCGSPAGLRNASNYITKHPPESPIAAGYEIS